MDCVISSVRAEYVEHTGIVITDSSDVELLSPFLELLVTITIACYILLQNTVATHRTPLVVVSSEPYLGKVTELIVVGYHLRHKMAVLVDDRHIFCTFMVKLTGVVVGEHEVVVNKTHIVCLQSYT